MSLWLTEDELIELTGYKGQRRQKKALGEMGVPFMSRASDGYPLVDREYFSELRKSHTVLKSRENKRKPRLEFVRQ